MNLKSQVTCESTKRYWFSRSSGSLRRSPLPALRLSPLDQCVVGLVGILCLAQVPIFMFPSWTLRYGCILALLPFGVWAGYGLLRVRDASAYWALGFLVVTVLAAGLSPARVISVFGWGDTTSAVALYVLVLAVWALARTMSQGASDAAGLVFISALVGNVVFGVVQIGAGVESGSFAVVSGRANGLFGNAAYFGTAVVGGFGYAAIRWVESGKRGWLASAAVLAFGAGLAGTRSAPILLSSLIVVLALVGQRRRVAVQAIVAASAFLFANWWVGTRGGSTSVGRLAGADGGGRTSIWRYGLAAFSDRPALGWGPAHFRTAVQGRYSPGFTRDRLAGPSTAWDDPHNMVVLLLVTVGGVGTLFAVGFIISNLRTARRLPWIGAAGLMSATWMLQPAPLSTLALGMFALGAASPAVAAARVARPRTSTAVAMSTVGVLLMTAVLVPSAFVRARLEQGDVVGADPWARMMWPDPISADLVADNYLVLVRFGLASEDSVRQWSSRAIRFDPTRPRWYIHFASRLGALGEVDAALATNEIALALQPWSVDGLRLQVELAEMSGDPIKLADARGRLCELLPDECTGGQGMVATGA